MGGIGVLASDTDGVPPWTSGIEDCVMVSSQDERVETGEGQVLRN